MTNQLILAASNGTLYIAAGGCALLALVAAMLFSSRIQKCSPGTEEMARIHQAIRQGAMAFLRTEYMILAFFVVVLSGVLTVWVDAGGWGDFLWKKC